MDFHHPICQDSLVHRGLKPAAVRRHLSGVAPGLLALLWAIPSRAQEAPPLEASAAEPAPYTVPDECPDEIWFRGEVLARLGATGPELLARSPLSVTVEARSHESYVGRVRLEGDSPAATERVIRHESCEQVLRALALVGAVLLEQAALAPSGLGAGPKPEGRGTKERPAPAGQSPSGLPSSFLVEREGPRRSWRVRTGPFAALSLQTGIAPERLWGPRIGWSVSVDEVHRHPRYELSLSYLRVHSGTLDYPSGKASFTWTSARVELVPWWAITKVVSAGPGLFLDFGELEVTGAAALTGRRVRTPLLNPGLAGLLGVRILPPLLAHLAVGGSLPARRPWFYFTEVQGNPDQAKESLVHRVPQAGVTLDLGLAATFQ